jgi:hypothetical protein
MKKFITGFFLATLFFAANAQVSFGPKAGANFSIVSYNTSNIKVDPLVVAFNAGAFFNYKFAKQLAVQAELFYSGEGSKYKIVGSPTVYTDKFGYMNIPVLLQFVSNGGFFLETGPQLGFLMSATESSEGTSTDVKSYVNSTKFSWCFGIGKLFAKKLGIDIRYAAGLSNLNKANDGSTIKGSILSIGLLYAIHVKS